LERIQKHEKNAGLFFTQDLSENINRLRNRLTTEDTEGDLSGAYEETQEHEKNAGIFFTQHESHNLKPSLTAGTSAENYPA